MFNIYFFPRKSWPLWDNVEKYGTARQATGDSIIRRHAPIALYPGKDPIPTSQEAGWAPEPVWTGGKSRPHWDSIPDRPVRSQSLYWLSYPALLAIVHWLVSKVHNNLRGTVDIIVISSKVLYPFFLVYLTLQNEGETFLRNVGSYSPSHVASHPRGSEPSTTIVHSEVICSKSL